MEKVSSYNRRCYAAGRLFVSQKVESILHALRLIQHLIQSDALRVEFQNKWTALALTSELERWDATQFRQVFEQIEQNELIRHIHKPHVALTQEVRASNDSKQYCWRCDKDFPKTERARCSCSAKPFCVIAGCGGPHRTKTDSRL